MKRLARLFAMMAILVASLAIIPAIGAGVRGAVLAGRGASPQAQSGTVPGTVPTATPTPTPGQVFPTATPPRPRPTPTSTPATSGDEGARRSRAAVQIGSYEVMWVTGNRFSMTIYAVTDNGWLYRSDDDGRSWRLMTTNPHFERFLMSPADPDVLYAGTGMACTSDGVPDGFLFKSTRGGRSWARLEGTANLQPLLAHPTDPDRLLAAGCDGLYSTDDGGSSWSLRGGSSQVNLWGTYGLRAMAAAPLATAPGQTPPHWAYLYASGVDADGVSIVAFSGDEGGTWEQLTPLVNPIPLGLAALEGDPYAAGRLWFADSQGVWSTEDFGASWAFGARGLDIALDSSSDNIPSGLHAIIYHENGTLFLGTARGLHQQLPGSDRWVFVPVDGLGSRSVNGLLVTVSNPRVLWLNSEGGVYRHGIE